MSKVCVYAICKNESKHIKRWYESMKEADEIYVLDTGSTDNSFKMLENLGVKVYKKEYDNWRFDVARNDSLALVPLDADICVCTDIDEVFNEGWRKELDSLELKEPFRLEYCLNFSFDKYNNPATTLLISKIHSRHNIKWVHAIHEVLEESIPFTKIKSDKIVLNHYPDRTKSRSNYLNLLEQSVIEEPDSERNLHYLGREYMYYNEHFKCISTLHKYLNHKNAFWNEERCASMRYIARSYKSLEMREEAIMWYQKAILESPNIRESYVELAYTYYEEEDYPNAYNLLKQALNITEKSTYINEDYCWNSFIYDLASICAYYTKHFEEAVIYAKEALEIDPDNLRIQLNLEIFEKE